MELKRHPLSERYPPLPPEDMAALVNDVGVHGLIHPIILLDGMVLDGWHRHLACKAAGVEPHFVPYVGDDPQAFVRSLNERRRHLTPAEKRKLAKTILAQHPERTNRSVAKETGVSHTLAGEIRREIEAEAEQSQQAALGNGNIGHNEVFVGDDATHSSPAATTSYADDGLRPLEFSTVHPEPASPPPTPVQRVEASGKRARGRPLGSKNKTKPDKEIKPKAEPQAERNDFVSAVSAAMSGKLEETVEIMTVMMRDEPRITTTISASRRRFFMENCSKAFGFSLVHCETIFEE